MKNSLPDRRYCSRYGGRVAYCFRAFFEKRIHFLYGFTLRRPSPYMRSSILIGLVCEIVDTLDEKSIFGRHKLCFKLLWKNIAHSSWPGSCFCLIMRYVFSLFHFYYATFENVHFLYLYLLFGLSAACSYLYNAIRQYHDHIRKRSSFERYFQTHLSIFLSFRTLKKYLPRIVETFHLNSPYWYSHWSDWCPSVFTTHSIWIMATIGDSVIYHSGKIAHNVILNFIQCLSQLTLAALISVWPFIAAFVTYLIASQYWLAKKYSPTYITVSIEAFESCVCEFIKFVRRKCVKD